MTVADASVSTDTVATEPAGGYQVAVPTGPGDLVPDVPVFGTLDAGDPRDEDGAWYDELTYAARGGESIVVTLESSDFDALVTVGQEWSGTWRELARDDDGGSGTNAELRYTFDADGLYAIRATAYEPSTGEYLLLLQSDVAGIGGAPGAVDTFSAPVPPLADGRDVQGELSELDAGDGGRRQDVYHFFGRAAETVTLTLESDDFDAYLVLLDADTGEQLATDDDGAGGTNALLTLTLPESGEYQVRATSFDAGETGAYTLRLERR